MNGIKFDHITKVFGDVVANDDISFSIIRGEILSILGENGSGKTTLLNVLDGIYQQDSGRILIDDEEVIIKSPRDAYSHKIGMVHQHYKLVDVFTAVENIVLGLSKKELKHIYETFGGNTKEKKFNKYSLKESALVVKSMCEKYGFILDPMKHVFDMSVSEKQTLEILKVLIRGVDTLILDEPTAVLTPQEIKHLFDVIRNMKKDGKTIVIITHKLNEVLEISDKVVVLRKGQYIQTVNTKDTNESILAELMVGQKIDLDIHRTELEHTGTRLIVRDLEVKDKEGNPAIKNISFDVYGSEILGIAGISGSGQRELLEAIAGLNENKQGQITFINPKENQPVTFFHKDLKTIKELADQGKFYFKDGRKFTFNGLNNKQITQLVNDGEVLFYNDEIIELMGKKPIEIRDLGIKLSFVPEDRLGMGLVGSMDLVDNMLLRNYRKGPSRMLKKDKSEEIAKRIVKELDVKTPSLHTSVSTLSGGNIQKILVGRELVSRPKILMAAYPVRGLDINSSYLIYNLLDKQKQTGTAVIYVGEDLDVLLALCDRILVLAGGRISGIVDPRKVTKEEVGLLMTSYRD